MSLHIHPSTLAGSLKVPSSKSHTLRSIVFAAMAEGTSHIEHYLSSPDTLAMMEAVRSMGAHVRIDKDYLEIKGVSGRPQTPQDVIQCGNSGQVLRFIGALAALLPCYTILTGDASIRQNRPVKPLLEGLRQLGAFAESALSNAYAPIIIKGPIIGSKAVIEGQDSQPVSGLLMAAAFAPHAIEVRVNQPGEKPWVDLTLDWFQRLGIKFQRSGYSSYHMHGNSCVEAFNYSVPGDFSTAAFPIAAALITNSQVTLHNIDMLDCQGDKAIIPLLEKMGASFEVDARQQTLKIKPEHRLKGTRIDVNDFVDALPILAVLGCFAEGRTEIVNGAIARHKESDRVHAIATELKKMGARIEEKPDGLVIENSALKGAMLKSYQDHRLGMALSVAAMGASTPSQILDVKCVDKTYPTFVEDFKALGAQLILCPTG